MGFSICDIEIYDVYDIISILCALVIIYIIICVLPKYNKNLKFEKSFFNHKAVKVLIVVLLLYCYLVIETPFFMLVLTLIFFIYWILNSQEHFEEVEEVKEEKQPLNIFEFKDLQNNKLEKEVDNPVKPFSDTTDSIVDLRDEEIFDQRDFMVITHQKDDYVNYKSPFEYIAGSFDCKKPRSLPILDKNEVIN